MVKKSKPIWWLLCVAAGLTLVITLVTWAVVTYRFSTQPQTGRMVLSDGTYLSVEIADTWPEQQQGLMGRKTLGENSGMLFVFAVPGTYTFWMKDTFLDLDFIWMRDGKVVELTEDVPAGAGMADHAVRKVTPQEPVDWVVEVPAGFIDKHGIQEGDQLDLRPGS